MVAGVAYLRMYSGTIRLHSLIATSQPPPSQSTPSYKQTKQFNFHLLSNLVEWFVMRTVSGCGP